MIEKAYLSLILVFFIGAFAVRNIKTYLSTRQSIKGKSARLTMSILLSTAIYGIIFLRLFLLDPAWIVELDLSAVPAFTYAGYALIFAGFLSGILALTAMKNSWRVGIKYDQKTSLVTTGIYRFSRNPYFLSYHILITGYILVFPSVILIALYFALAVIFHKMILEEEHYLQSVHGAEYSTYKERVKRYFSI